MSQENHPKPLKVLWEQLLGEDVSHLQGCFAENEENKALFHGLPHKMIVLGNVLSPFFICFSPLAELCLACACGSSSSPGRADVK